MEIINSVVRVIEIDFLWENSTINNSALPMASLTDVWKENYHSSVAYSIEDTQEAIANKNLSVKVRFQNISNLQLVQIRARNVQLGNVTVLTGDDEKFYPDKQALGDVSPTTVYFDSTGYSVSMGNTKVPCILDNPQFPNLGVGIYHIYWQWEYRLFSKTDNTGAIVWEDEWQPIRMTHHHVYITLSKPWFPWSPTILPAYEDLNTYGLPVRESALKIACDWASGCKTADEAAKQIALKLNSSGIFAYDPASNYYKETMVIAPEGWTGPQVNGQIKMGALYFHKAVERIAGGLGFGKNVNCLDCALIVQAFANALGCNLKVGKLQNTDVTNPMAENYYLNNRFELKPIKAIGLENSEVTMQGVWHEDGSYFAFHAIAWNGPDTSGSDTEDNFEDPGVIIYDACVQFVTGKDEKGNEIYSSGVGVVIGTEKDTGKYRALLGTDNDLGKPRVKPQPVTVVKVQLK